MSSKRRNFHMVTKLCCFDLFALIMFFKVLFPRTEKKFRWFIYDLILCNWKVLKLIKKVIINEHKNPMSSYLGSMSK